MTSLDRLRKLHLVADQDHVPIITLVNKLDHEGCDPFDLLDEIEQSMALDVTPSSWPLVYYGATTSISDVKRRKSASLNLFLFTIIEHYFNTDDVISKIRADPTKKRCTGTAG